MRARFKAGLIALCSLVFPAHFIRNGKRVKLNFLTYQHPILTWFLSLFLDVRVTRNDKQQAWIELRSSEQKKFEGNLRNQQSAKNLSHQSNQNEQQS
jgi:hypothetical protein